MKTLPSARWTAQAQLDGRTLLSFNVAVQENEERQDEHREGEGECGWALGRSETTRCEEDEEGIDHLEDDSCCRHFIIQAY